MNEGEFYHRVTYADCIGIADQIEKTKLKYITDFHLLHELAHRWCNHYGYRLGGHLGNWSWEPISAQGGSELDMIM